MNGRSRFSKLAVLCAAWVLLSMLPACGGDGRQQEYLFGRNGEETLDGGGMTQSKVMSLSLQEQFELVRERDTRMNELLAEAQLQISAEPWNWGLYGVIPTLDINVWSVPGMTSDNSYFLEMWVWIEPEGGVGDPADLEPMIAYFESKGWAHEVHSSSEFNHEVLADTGEGYFVNWKVQQSGQYNLGVTSRTYWGGSKELLHAIGNRVPRGGLRIGPSAPGVHPEFPTWDDPAIYAPDLLDP